MVAPRVFAGADGIISVDAFAQGCLLMKFAEKHFSILETPCPRVGEQWEIVRAQMSFGGLAVVPARIGRVNVHAFIGTGAERLLGNRALHSAAILERKLQDPDSSTVVSAEIPQLVPGNIIETPSFRMGSMTISNMRVVFGDFEVFEEWDVNEEPAIVLGMDVLGITYSMMLEFTRQEFGILSYRRRHGPRAPARAGHAHSPQLSAAGV